MSKNTLLILGYGEHGKDKFAEYLADELQVPMCASSSMIAAEAIVFPWFHVHYPGRYATVEECFNDRRRWRYVWHDLISEYNAKDGTRLARKILESQDWYIGMRSVRELSACREAGLFSHTFWVDAGGRKPPEGAGSNSVHYDPSFMVRVDNSGTLDELRAAAVFVANLLRREFAN